MGADRAVVDLRRAHVSRVRGALGQPRSQHGGCDAGEAEVHLHLASGSFLVWRSASGVSGPRRRPAAYPDPVRAVNATDDVVSADAPRPWGRADRGRAPACPRHPRGHFPARPSPNSAVRPAHPAISTTGERFDREQGQAHARPGTGTDRCRRAARRLDRPSGDTSDRRGLPWGPQRASVASARDAHAGPSVVMLSP